MEVAAIDERDIDIGMAESDCGVQAAEAAADDDNVASLGRGLLRHGVRGFQGGIVGRESGVGFWRAWYRGFRLLLSHVQQNRPGEFWIDGLG